MWSRRTVRAPATQMAACGLGTQARYKHMMPTHQNTKLDCVNGVSEGQHEAPLQQDWPPLSSHSVSWMDCNSHDQIAGALAMAADRSCLSKQPPGSSMGHLCSYWRQAKACLCLLTFVAPLQPQTFA